MAVRADAATGASSRGASPERLPFREPLPGVRQLARGSGRCKEACRDFRSASAPASRDFRQAARV